VTLRRHDAGTSFCQRTYDLPAFRRVTVAVRDVCQGIAITAGATPSGIVESSGPAIAVERSTYWEAPGQVWGAGASAALTRLPEEP
jgi:hypothetical protein